MSVVIHEVSHGFTALLLGDKTAKYAGRLTLNPIPHLDFFGSILLPLILIVSRSPFLIGWAKPVPYNPYNLSNQKWGPALVGAAGPLSNFTVAIIFGLLVRFEEALPLSDAFIAIITYITLINLVLGVFNLLPIPPLDGSKVIFALLPYRFSNIQQWLEIWGFLLLILFIFIGGGLIFIITNFLFSAIAGFSL